MRALILLIVLLACAGCSSGVHKGGGHLRIWQGLDLTVDANPTNCYHPMTPAR